LEDFIQQTGITEVLWLLDSPVSNSGRLKMILREQNPDWQVELVASPDAVLIKATNSRSSDSVILDKCSRWVDLLQAKL